MSPEKFINIKNRGVILVVIAFCSACTAIAKPVAQNSAVQNNEINKAQSAVTVNNTSDSVATKSELKPTPLARVTAQKQLLESESHKNHAENNSTSKHNNEINVDKTLTLEISELRDNSGLVYLGGKVTVAELSGYLAQLKDELGTEQFAIYRGHQAARDHQSFHVTLINPYEYQAINKENLKVPKHFNVTLHGLGKVKKDDKSSYFVVASSSDGQYIRQSLLLNNKDFHVTLGFFPDDVYGVSKGRDTLINK